MNNETTHDNDRIAIWCPEKAMARLGCDKTLIQRLVGLFLRDTPELLENARLGIVEENYKKAFVPLHSIKGTSSNFSAGDFEAACEGALKALSDKDWRKAGELCAELMSQYERLKPEFEEFIS